MKVFCSRRRRRSYWSLHETARPVRRRKTSRPRDAGNVAVEPDEGAPLQGVHQDQERFGKIAIRYYHTAFEIDFDQFVVIRQVCNLRSFSATQVVCRLHCQFILPVCCASLMTLIIMMCMATQQFNLGAY